MSALLRRAVGGLLVMVLVGPSVVAATCELTCAMARHHERADHHHGTQAPTETPCHEHQGATTQRAGVQANPHAFCHESGDLPSAVVDAWLNTVLVHPAPAAHVVVAPAIAAVSIVRAPDRRAPFDPRPPHRPLRV